MNKKRPLKYRIDDVLQGFLIAFFIIAGFVFEYVGTFLVMIFKYPKRSLCKVRGEHSWRHYGGGFSPFPGPKYPFICMTCGTRSNGSMDDLEKKGFKGRARI